MTTKVLCCTANGPRSRCPAVNRRLRDVIFQRIVVEVYAENCYLIADEEQRAAIVVDPGEGAAPQVAAELARLDLSLAAVLLTHGHADHIWDAARVAGDLPVLVPAPDRYRLEAENGVPRDLREFGRAPFTSEYVQPANIQPLGDPYFDGGGAEIAPGVVMRALAAPGHTEGSTLYFFSGTWSPGVTQAADAPADSTGLILSGDVLFRDGIGRTDFPGGDQATMESTLRTLRKVIDPAFMVFPGHGPATTFDRELKHNPFLV